MFELKNITMYQKAHTYTHVNLSIFRLIMLKILGDREKYKGIVLDFKKILANTYNMQKF